MTSTSVDRDFDAWYQSEYQRLVNAVAVAIGDSGAAADSVAEAFTRALARWKRVGPMEHRTGWVYRVAVNHAKRSFRRSAHERRLLTAQAAVTPAVVAPVEGDHELWQAVSRLPERTRIVVALRYIADQTEPAIAAALGIRRGTVATMLRRAHDRLAKELDPPTTASYRQELADAVSL